MCDVGVVVVTYNRLEKLKIALQTYEEQLYKPQCILVVDNHSTDGTTEFLELWKRQSSEIEHKVLALPQNIGGSGGFYEGLKAIQREDIDWIWVADDDAYLKNDCLLILIKYLEMHLADNYVALCSSVYTDDRIDTWHRRKFTKRCGFVRIEQRIDITEYRKESFSVDLFSYVGTMMKKSALMSAGLPEKEFFISYDDSEHSIRMRKLGDILCIPEAKVIHDTQDAEDDRITWKKYYGIRNKLYSYHRCFGIIQMSILAMHYYIKNYNNRVLRQMTSQAIKNAFCGKLGVDTLYKPGWTDEE